MHWNQLFGFLTLILFSLAGVLLLFFTRRVQAWILAFYERFWLFRRMTPWWKRVGTDGWVVEMKVGGAVVVGFSLLVLYALLRSHEH
jgi:hypothetical protein